MTVVPMWARYMFEVSRDFPNPGIAWAAPPGVRPDDRGDSSRGRRGSPTSLIYRHAEKPSDDGIDGIELPNAPGQPPA